MRNKDRTPKTADGRKLYIGMRAWLDGYHCGFAGPHLMNVIGIKEDEAEVDDGSTTCPFWCDVGTLFARKPGRKAR